VTDRIDHPFHAAHAETAGNEKAVMAAEDIRRRLRVDEVVPCDETLPSPDGHFYRCHTVGRDYDEDGNPNEYLWDGERRCFFAPPQWL